MVFEGPVGVRVALNEHGKAQQVARAVVVRGGPLPEGRVGLIFDFDAHGPVDDVFRLIRLVVADGGEDVVRGTVVGAVHVLGDVAVGVVGGVLLRRGLGHGLGGHVVEACYGLRKVGELRFAPSGLPQCFSRLNSYAEGYPVIQMNGKRQRTPPAQASGLNSPFRM